MRLALITLFLAGAAGRSMAQKSPIIPPNASYGGLTYGEWGALWWQSMFATPIVDGDHPFFSGGIAGVYQNVVMLVGVSDGVIDLTIPVGSALFFPVVNSECSVIEPDPYHGDDEETLRACANGHVDNTSGHYAIVDGIPVANLDDYRFESPLFQFGPLPENNLFGEPAGTISDAVDAGIYLMLRPLSPGVHTLEFGGSFDEQGFSINSVYNITVK